MLFHRRAVAAPQRGPKHRMRDGASRAARSSRTWLVPTIATHTPTKRVAARTRTVWR